jgi:hypothetical protein
MSETPKIIEDFLKGNNDAGGTIASLEAEAKRLSDEIDARTKINKKVTDTYIKEINTLRFCFDEVLGELGWGDEIEETGIDPLVWARGEIKRLQNREKSLQLRDAANGKCKKCGTLHGEPIIHCDVCGAFQ